ncbi:MAG: hypothetical protein L6R38_009665, partial [Xanthoria sp. 2 TBL-2021]
MALPPLIIGLLWQLISIYDGRLFHDRQIPNWAIAIVETLGFLAFLALFVGHRVALIDGPRYLALGEMLLLAYDSAVWIILWYVLPLFITYYHVICSGGMKTGADYELAWYTASWLFNATRKAGGMCHLRVRAVPVASTAMEREKITLRTTKKLCLEMKKQKAKK